MNNNNINTLTESCIKTLHSFDSLPVNRIKFPDND